jgi:hypothetical protein
MNFKNGMSLEKREDYWNWDKLIQHSQTIEELTPFEKEKVKRAFLFLREELGEEFLQDAFSEGHPICNYIGNLAAWTRRWISWFAEALSELKNQGNYTSLLSRIKDKNKFDEGILVLENGFKFSKSDFEITVDPPINVSGKEKIPDLKLADKNTKEEFFVEISQMAPGEPERRALETLDTVMDVLWRYIPFLHYSGYIHKKLSKSHLNEVVKKVESMLERAKKDNSFHELALEGVINIAVAPEKDREVLEKWAADKGLRVGELKGPPFDVDEILRTRRKIEEEQRQLPREYPNIIIIRNTRLFSRLSDVREAINELEEEIYEYPHLLFAIISGKYLGMAYETSFMKDNHVYLEKSRNELFVEKYLILFNRFCEHKISPTAIAKIYNSFKNY